MNIEKRTQEILNCMVSCSEPAYHKSEILPELLALQRALVALTFNAEEFELGNLKIWDVEAHLTQMNEECRGVATDLLIQFKLGCRMICNIIKAEISGNRGEAKAFSSLEKLKNENIIIKNIELSNESCRSELDAVVLTRNGAFIIEVKNTAKDIFIDERGDYYRTGEYTRLDCNIVQKMSNKKELLQEVIQAAGLGKIEVFEILVFTNNRIEVKNHCSSIRPCFLGQLPFIIDEWNKETCVSSDEMYRAAKAIESARNEATFPMNFDVVQFKMDFARLIAELEVSSTVEIVPEIGDRVSAKTKVNEKRTLVEIIRIIFDSKYVKAVGSVACLAVLLKLRFNP